MPILAHVFVTQAHSFRQQARLAITLAWVAGYANVLTILTCGHVTSHVSGTTSDLGRAVVLSEWATVGFLGFLLLTFGIGAVLSGVATEVGRRLGWESIYALPMSVQALLLAAFAIGVELHDPAKVASGSELYVLTGLASLAMGVQNATITRISGGVVRTTHVTGVLTDLGLEAAQLAFRVRDRIRRGLPHAPRVDQLEVASPLRLLLLASILGSFALGAALGTLAFRYFPAHAMMPPVLFMLWLITSDVRKPIAELEPSSLVGGQRVGLDPRIALFHCTHDRARPGKVHRMPNLTEWAHRLPSGARVIVLDLDGVPALDANSALELRALLGVTRAQGRTLIISGLDRDELDALRRAGVGDLLDDGQVCPDVELALARAVVVLEQHDGQTCRPS